MADQIKQFADATAEALKRVNTTLKKMTMREQSPSSYGWVSVLYANLPTPGTSTGLGQFCTDCRKSGEGPGAGTGTVVFTDGTGVWLRIADNTPAAT